MASTTSRPWSFTIKVVFLLGVCCDVMQFARSQCLPCVCAIETRGKYSGKKSINCKNKKLLLIPSNVPTDVELWWLSHNSISTISDNFFQGRSNILELDLSYNSLTSLSEKSFAGLTGLRKLNLYGNQLSEIKPQAFSTLSSLEKIYLNVNKITSIPDRMLENMPKLSEVALSNNQITHIPPNTFDGTTNVEFLFITNNHLKKISTEFSKIYRLAFVDFSHNHISTIANDALDGSADAVIHWNIQGNNLTELPTAALEKMTIIHELYVGDNQITRLTYNDLQALNKTTSIDLGPNPFECSCELTVLQDWINTTSVSVQDKDSLTCLKENITQNLLQYDTRMCGQALPTKSTAIGPSPTIDTAAVSKEKILIMSVSVGLVVSLGILLLLGLYIYFESVRPRTRRYNQERTAKSDDEHEVSSTSSGRSLTLKHEVVPLQSV